MLPSKLGRAVGIKYQGGTHSRALELFKRLGSLKGKSSDKGEDIRNYVSLGGGGENLEKLQRETRMFWDF